ncbi:hypothetical protein FE257_012014 [Aspergillus nanangensis]|uniref:V-SNARE n=1 Tax=Aspergillus nanangensis TaxID=2582783 RepID=A0AAD4GQ95_ASPNN|nr:hypothetical protein FE257_012014 [Aspergillus nanangensis]
MTTMPDKRKPPTSSTGSSPYAKRSRPSYADDGIEEGKTPTVTPYERPRNHPFYGQKSAFPGLDAAGEDELFYGPADDGMEYLRMVRSEANSLPILFTAPVTAQPPNEDTTEKDQPEENQGAEGKEHIIRGGVYVDGVYVAPRDAPIPYPEYVESAYSEAQTTYYNLLHHRFLLLRSILKCTPPPAAIAALDDSHPISFPRHSKTARKEWRRLLLEVDPQMVQLACMDMDSVLGVLGILARLTSENIRSGDAQRVRQMGAWAWGLLSKCRDIGQLSTEEVGEIRDLGKRAVKILHKMKEEEVSKQKDQSAVPTEGITSDDESDDEQAALEGGDDMGHEQEGSDAAADADQDMPDAEKETVLAGELEQAKSRLQAQLQTGEDEPPTEDAPMEGDGAVEAVMQTKSMLDMIITVVGEFFGQRDLLQTREVWE